MKNLIISLFLLVFLFGCSERLQKHEFTECDYKPSSNVTKKELIMAYAICQNAANLDTVERKGEYERWSLKHRAHILYMQNIYTVVALMMVVLVLGFGLILSYFEFRSGKTSENNIKLGATGIEISSKFLGVIILIVSLGFAYLFLEKAYPVYELGDNVQKSSQKKANTIKTEQSK